MSEISRQDIRAVVKPGEDVVASMAGKLREELKTVIASGVKELILDLGGVEMIDSVGLGVFIAAYNSMDKTGGILSVINASKDITDLFSSMRLDRYFKVTTA